MKTSSLRLILSFVLASVTAFALPLTQHRLQGVIHAIDLEKRTLTLEPGKKDEPTEFVITEGRTKLRCDQKPATLADLVVGQTVVLYHTREMGREVATEVTWSSSPRAPKITPKST